MINSRRFRIFMGVALCLMLFVAAVGCSSTGGNDGNDAKPDGDNKANVSNAPGVTADSILLGAYQPMTGSESSYFRMGKGADAWYQHVNENGGVNGRKIDFKMKDDGYEPARTKAIVKEFIERDKVFAMANPLGSAPTSAVIDYIVEQGVPLIGAGTGAAKNVNYPSELVWPLYLDYTREGGQLVEMAQNQFGAQKVAMIYQNDPSGQTDLAGAEEYANANGVEFVAKQGYEVSEVDIASQVITSQQAEPDVLILFAAPEHLAKALIQVQKLGWDVPIVASFIGLDSVVFDLAGEEAVNGIIISTIFRSPDSDSASIDEFRKILKKYYPKEEPSAIHMWGYSGAQVVTEALERAGKDITRENFIEAMGSIQGWKGSIIPEVNLSKDQRVMVSSVSWMHAKDGEFVPFTP